MKKSYRIEERKEIAKRYKDLITNSYITLTKKDKSLIHKAMDLALDAHKNQRRRSGEPYIYHPMAVAKIVSEEIGLGAMSIAIALLHDVVEDSDYTLEDIEHYFGKKVALIINGLTKISAIRNQEIIISEQAENYKKLFFSLSEDLRVILIKIADRLHNMRTMDFMPPHKQKTIAAETLYIFAPLAHRLSLYVIKSELEDLSLKYLESDAFYALVKKLEESREEREKYINLFIETIEKRLIKNNIQCQLKGRSKSIFSIWKKMNTQKVPFESIYDIFAIRIIYESDEENEKFLAWKIYSIITDLYFPNPKRLRDWISQPKSTGYESLHTTVMGPQGRWVEVQIRSLRMDDISEKGVAAHYRYKYGFNKEESRLDMWLNKVKESLKDEERNTIEFIDDFKLNLYTKEIYVFTHKGDLMSLPKDATALDFAYSVHSKIGDTCLGAKINGKLVALNYILQSGDQVEIINSIHQRPKEDWLNIVTTSKARSKIKNALNLEKKKTAEEGKEILKRKLKNLKIHFNETTINSLVLFFKTSTSQEVFYKVGRGEIRLEELKKFNDHIKKGIYRRFLKSLKKSSPKFKFPILKKNEPKKEQILLFGSNEEKLSYALSSCCNPIAGDRVFGFITINQGIKVHREDCNNALSLHAHYDYRIIKAKWIMDSIEVNFKIILHIKGIDRVSLIKDISMVITEKMKLNITNMNVSSENGIFDGEIALIIKNKEQVEKLSEQIKKIEGIYSVDRVYENSSDNKKEKELSMR